MERLRKSVKAMSILSYVYSIAIFITFELLLNMTRGLIGNAHFEYIIGICIYTILIFLLTWYWSFAHNIKKYLPSFKFKNVNGNIQIQERLYYFYKKTIIIENISAFRLIDNIDLDLQVPPGKLYFADQEKCWICLNELNPAVGVILETQNCNYVMFAKINRPDIEALLNSVSVHKQTLKLPAKLSEILYGSPA